MVIPSATVPRVSAKLPKLSLKKYDGTLTTWTPFWDAYKTAIRSNHSLSSVEKFTYLQTLLEGKAKEAISGLSLTDANYTAAIGILERRFGDKELIIAAHMDKLMSLEAVHSDYHIADLRRLYDRTESSIRALDVLGVKAESYGALLMPIFIKRIPSDLRLNITRKLPADDWNIEQILKVCLEEIEARERATLTSKGRQPTTPRQPRDYPTANTFTSGGENGCVYSKQDGHGPTQCNKVVSIDDWKGVIRKNGRCFNCLRRGHLG